MRTAFGRFSLLSPVAVLGLTLAGCEAIPSGVQSPSLSGVADRPLVGNVDAVQFIGDLMTSVALDAEPVDVDPLTIVFPEGEDAFEVILSADSADRSATTMEPQVERR